MDDIVGAFRHAAGTLAFYRNILAARGLDPASVETVDDFHARVPILSKHDVFARHSLPELCQSGVWDDMVSAIFSSGTSGDFAHSLITRADVQAQAQQLDGFLRLYFDADAVPPVLINALPMGVSFASTFPVIPTGVRSDIVLHAIRTLREHVAQLVVVADPHFAKKIIEEGHATGIAWDMQHISFVIGGTWTSSSHMRYLQVGIGAGRNGGNRIYGTMGLTEVGLNVFFQPPDLIDIRDRIQRDPRALARLFGQDGRACPSLMYYLPERAHVEIPASDGNGFGDIVISHLDTSIKTPLMRYNTRDQGKLVDADLLAETLRDCDIALPAAGRLPIIAIRGRIQDLLPGSGISVADVKEALYRDPGLAASITGHFRLREDAGQPVLRVQLERSATPRASRESVLQAILWQMNVGAVAIEFVPYEKFDCDVELNYESKWKHI